MPIQFRCGACQQLLGIAKRKSGSVVDCPTCRTKTLVPSTASAAGEAPPPIPAKPIRNQPQSIFDKVDVDKLLQKPMRPEVVESDSAVAVAPPPVRRKMVFTTNLMEDPLIEPAQVKKETVVEEEPQALKRLATEDVEPVDDEPFALSPVPVLTPQRKQNHKLWLPLALAVAAVAIGGAFFVGHWFGANRPLY